MHKIAIITINNPGLNSALKLLNILNTHYKPDKIAVFYKKDSIINNNKNLIPFNNIDDILSEAWTNFNIIICFLATGIVIRKIAHKLKSKTSDPAVLVMSFDLTQVVPLISGHIGGANEFALKLERIIPNCKSFISTATDQTNVFAFDLFAKDQNFTIENINKLAVVSNQLINNQQVNVFTYPTIFELIKKYKQYSNKIIFKNIDDVNNQDKPLSVSISPFNIQNHKQLIIRIPSIYIGIGLNKNTPFKTLIKALHLFTLEHSLNINDITKIGSFKEKENEPGLKELSEHLSIPITFLSADSINSVDYNLSDSAANKFFNIKGVAEPSAIITSKHKTLFLKKHSYFREVTIASAF